MEFLHFAAQSAVILAEGEGYTPLDLTTALTAGAGNILGFIGAGVGGGVAIMLAMVGINRGLSTFSKTAKKG